MAADLVRAMDPCPKGVTVEFVSASSYGAGTETSGSVKVSPSACACRCRDAGVKTGVWVERQDEVVSADLVRAGFRRAGEGPCVMGDV